MDIIEFKFNSEMYCNDAWNYHCLYVNGIHILRSFVCIRVRENSFHNMQAWYRDKPFHEYGGCYTDLPLAKYDVIQEYYRNNCGQN